MFRAIPCVGRLKVRHESETHNGLVAQWLELLVQFRVVRGSIPCEVILLFSYMSRHTDLMVSMLSTLVWTMLLACPHLEKLLT